MVFRHGVIGIIRVEATLSPYSSESTHPFNRTERRGRAQKTCWLEKGRASQKGHVRALLFFAWLLLD